MISAVFCSQNIVCRQLLSWERGGGGGPFYPLSRVEPCNSVTCATLPQLVSYRCLAATMGQSVMALSRLCPCPHTTHHHHITPHPGAQSVVGLAAGRAGQRSQSCSSAPRPGPPRPQHGTRHGLSFSLSAPARPRRRAGPALRTPHSHDPTHILQSAGWPACSHRRAPAPPPSPPARGRSCRRCGGGGAGPCWRQPSPAPTWHRSAGQGGPGPALAAHNNSPTTAERENPRKNTIRTTFAHLIHHNLGRGHSRVGWARLAWASLSGAAHFLESGAISETLTRQSRSGAALGFAELTAGTAAAVTSR